MCSDCVSEHEAFETPSAERAARADSILIVEDKALCRAGLAHLLISMGLEERPAFAANLEQALEAAASPAVRLALVNLSSIGFDFEGLRRLAQATRAPVVVMDDRPNATFASLARQAGARGYVCETYELDQAAAVFHAVLEGAERFPRGVQPARRAAALPKAGLSPRQIDVLKCIVAGMSNEEIARALGITRGTVKLHIHAILRATGKRNRTEAALMAGHFLAPVTDV